MFCLKPTKNKTYANLVIIFTFKSEVWGFNTLLVLTLDLYSWRSYIFQIKTNVQLNTLSYQNNDGDFLFACKFLFPWCQNGQKLN